MLKAFFNLLEREVAPFKCRRGEFVEPPRVEPITSAFGAKVDVNHSLCYLETATNSMKFESSLWLREDTGLLNLSPLPCAQQITGTELTSKTRDRYFRCALIVADQLQDICRQIIGDAGFYSGEF